MGLRLINNWIFCREKWPGYTALFTRVVFQNLSSESPGLGNCLTNCNGALKAYNFDHCTMQNNVNTQIEAIVQGQNF